MTKVHHLWNLLQVEEDLREGVTGAVPIPHADEGKEKVIAAMVSNVEAMIRADRKITALKELQVSKKKNTPPLFLLFTSIVCEKCHMNFCMQGHIWRTGFECDELKAIVFEDVADALEKWHSSGIKVCSCSF